MIARLWTGRTRAEDRDQYLKYLENTGVPGCQGVSGNTGVQILARLDGDVAEFVFVSFWESMEAIKGFAGEDTERAVYYPEDRRYLLSLDPKVRHFDVPVNRHR